MVKEAIILAGGFGTRLLSVVSDVPKPMAPVNGKPFLDYQLLYLKHFGVTAVVLSVGYLHEKIISHYKDSFQGIKIAYSIEQEPLGTGGGIRKAMELCTQSNVLVLNGDSFFEIDLHSFSHHHYAFESDATLALREVSDASRYGTIELSPAYGDRGRKIISFKEKSGLNQKGIINAGVYLLNKECFLKNTAEGINFSIEKDFFEKNTGKLNFFGCLYNSYFIDIGIPEDYTKAQNEFKGFKY